MADNESRGGTGELSGNIRRPMHDASGDDSAKPMPAKPESLTKFYDIAVETGDCGPSAVIAVITTDRVDRDGEVVVPSGGILKNYLGDRPGTGNRIVMYGHAKGRPEEGEAGLPIAKTKWLKPTRDKTGLIARYQFDMDDPFSFRICGKVKRGFLGSHSITFLPIEYGPPTAEEIRARPDWKNAKCIYRKWELIEFSIVAVPANVDAVTLAKQRRLSMSDTESVTAEVTATEVEEKALGENTGILGGLAVPDEHVDEENVRKNDKNTAEDEPEPDPEDLEEVEQVKRGDHVKCKAPHCKGYGVVKSIHKGEMVPDTEDDVYGSKDEPACRVQLYKKMGDGFAPTEHHRGLLCKHCEKCDTLKPPSKKKGCATTREGWTDEQRAAYKAALMASEGYKKAVENAVTYQLAVKVGKA